MEPVLPRCRSLRHYSDQDHVGEETSTSDLAPQPVLPERYMVLNIEGALRALQQQGGSKSRGAEGCGDFPSTWRTDPRDLSSACHQVRNIIINERPAIGGLRGTCQLVISKGCYNIALFLLWSIQL